MLTTDIPSAEWLVAQASSLPGPQRLRFIEELLSTLAPDDALIRLDVRELWNVLRRRLEGVG